MPGSRIALALAALAAPALAQSGASGSAFSFSSNRALPAAGGPSQSASYWHEATVAQALTGPLQTSASYAFEGGVAWVTEELDATGPVVFGVGDPRGHKDGGSAETVYGRGFAEPGAGVTTVDLGGAAASAVNVLGDSSISLVAPPGVDLLGNPLGVVDVAVANANGARAAKDAFAFTPALVGHDPARIGATFELHAYAAPGDFQDLYFGIPLPGFALPVAGIDGAFDLVAFFSSPTSSAFAGSDTTTWPLFMPAAPSLVGQSLDFQAFSLATIVPLDGAFTNVHTLQIID